MNSNTIYSKIKEMKSYAIENNIPIMQDEGIEFLTSFINKKQIKRILEVGTAIGYSSIMMALCDKSIHVTTIERDEERYLEALKNVKSLKLEDRITLIFNDALNVSLNEEYDLIFIDASKGKNKDFFNHFEGNLDMDGYIITDNMGFHGYIEQDINTIESKNIRNIVTKIKDYIYFLDNHMLYKTTIYKMGDGIAVTERRG